jgi:hypothetical protein
MAKRVLISSLKDSTKIAARVELADGKQYFAKRAVILSVGSIRTPHLSPFLSKG